jgi:hypothetical protein
MRPCEMPSRCEECGAPAEHCEHAPAEGGYRLRPLCWLHAAIRREAADSRLDEVLAVGPVAYLDRGRAGGDCECPDCGRRYFDHPPLPSHPFLNQLCDGSLVKL